MDSIFWSGTDAHEECIHPATVLSIIYVISNVMNFLKSPYFIALWNIWSLRYCFSDLEAQSCLVPAIFQTTPTQTASCFTLLYQVWNLLKTKEASQWSSLLMEYELSWSQNKTRLVDRNWHTLMVTDVRFSRWFNFNMMSPHRHWNGCWSASLILPPFKPHEQLSRALQLVDGVWSVTIFLSLSLPFRWAKDNAGEDHGWEQEL